MDELKKRAMEIVHEINIEWVTAIKTGEQEGGIDLSVVLEKYTEHMKNLDGAFAEANTRLKGKKKSFWGF